MRPSRYLGLTLVAAVLAACGPPAPIVFEDDVVEVTVRRGDGAIDLRDKTTGVEARNLHFAVDAVGASGATLATSLGRAMSCRLEQQKDGDVVQSSLVTCDADTGAGVRVHARLSLNAASPGVLRWETSFESRAGAGVTLRRVYPFRLAQADAGSLAVGSDPSTVRVLQNGSDELIDFFVDLYPGNTALSDRSQPAIVRAPSTYSNGSVIAYDLQSGASFLAGFVSFDWATPQIALAGDPAATALPDGRTPMTELWAEARFPWDAPAPKGTIVSGGAAVLIFGQPTPQAALEAYGDLVASQQAITLPPAPYSGWDSWYVGPQGNDLTEDWIRTQADALAGDFQRYGLASMELDSGWQDAWGDWNARASFPGGMSATTAHIAATGLKPEIWIAPLDAELTSQVATQHPDWLLEKSMFGAALVPADKRGLDISNPDVLAHVRDLGARLRDWGFQSVKMDYAYYTLMSELPVDVGVTNVSAYRAAVKAFHEALGPGVYLTNNSMCFPNYGLVDGFRIGLDTWPCWDGGDCRGDSPQNTGINGQGIKPALRMAARRYWMNGRIWWNHHDQVFFRDLVGEEARAWLSAAALLGGMISLGEDATTLTDEQIADYRRILPLQGITGRPLDLFQREFPEVWHLQTGAGADAAQVVGLFNWGTNRDLSASPPGDMAEEARTVTFDFAAAGLDATTDWLVYEYWTNTFVGAVHGQLAVELQPRTVRVYRLVPAAADRPVYLATSRHLLMGAGFVDGLSFDAPSGVLTGNARTTLGDVTDLYFYVPPGYGVTYAEMDGVLDLTPEMVGENLMRMRFTGLDGAPHPFSVTVAPQ